MMKIPRKNALFCLLAFLSAFCPGHGYGSGHPGAGGEGLIVLSESSQRVVLQNHVGRLFFSEIATPAGMMTRIRVAGYVTPVTPGLPELPLISRHLGIPAGTRAEVKVLSFEEKTYDLSSLGFSSAVYPSQPGKLKSGRTGQDGFVIHSEFYRTDTLYRPRIAEVIHTGRMRGKDLGVIRIQPFRYNPVKNQLVVLENLLIQVDFVGTGGGKSGLSKDTYSTPLFATSFRQLLNPGEEAKAVAGTGPVGYVILADPVFRDSLQDFIAWKKRKGFHVTELYKGDPGVGSTPAEFRSALQALYDAGTPENPAPSFLLLVGDVGQIPPSKSGSYVTDLYYACYDGADDYIPDLFYGRFSANTIDELMPQIHKTLEYEQFRFPDPSFLSGAVLIAGVDPTYATLHGNGQINYAISHYFNSAHGINPHAFLYPASGSSADQIRQLIGQGVGFVNYTGHGFPDRWDNPRLSVTDIPSFQNEGRYPLMIGNGCETNRFEIASCFGEALLRTPGKGAIGYIGGSNDSYWDEDYYWAVGVGPILTHPLYEQTSPGAYDLTFHDHGEDREEWYDTQAQMIFAGNLAVQAGNPFLAKYYWEIYHLMGDPSLMIYYGIPGTITANHPDSIPAGLTYLGVDTSPFSYAAVSAEGMLLDAGFADSSGTIILTLPEDLVADSLELVITGKNLQPYSAIIPTGDVQGVFIGISSLSLDDSSGNSDGLPDHGETISFNLGIRNHGLTDANGLVARLRTADPYLSVSDSIAVIGNLAAGQSVQLSSLFSMNISDTVPDLHGASLRIGISDIYNRHWTYYDRLQLLAPAPEISMFMFHDSLAGNNNHRPDAGELMQARAEVVNHGHSTLGPYQLSLMPGQGFSLLNPTISRESLAPGASFIHDFNLATDAGLTTGSEITLELHLDAAPVHALASLTRPVGIAYEDFERNAFSDLPWSHDPANPWIITVSDSHDGKYSLRSPDIGNSQGAEISLLLFAPENAVVSFSHKVSSEAGFDFLRFLVNGAEREKWSGEGNWERSSCPVSPGLNRLTWRYSKDGNTTHGLDAAWIDHLFFPGMVHRVPVKDSIDDSGANGNGRLNPGEAAELIFVLRNPGITGSGKVTAELQPVHTALTAVHPVFSFESYVDRTDTLLTCRFGITVSSSVPDQEKIPVLLTLTDSSRGSWTYYDIFAVDAPRPVITHVFLDDTTRGNGNGRPDKDEIASLLAGVRNDGMLVADNLVCSLQIEDRYRPYIQLVDSVYIIGTLLPGESADAPFSLRFHNIPGNYLEVPLRVTAGSQEGAYEKMHTLILGRTYDDFESGDLSYFPWATTGVPWEVSSTNVFEGRYAAVSPVMGNNQSATLSLNIFVLAPDTTRFRLRVSSEKNYDFLGFYLDGQLVNRWSGETGWMQLQYPLSEGCHNLSWKYSKDQSLTGGDDLAMIDLVVLPGFVSCSRSAGIVSVLSPVPGPWLGESETVSVRLKNHGADTLTSFTMGYILNQAAPVTETLERQVLPGQTTDFSFAAPADFSGIWDHHLLTYARAPGDTIYTDDSLHVTISKPELIDIALTGILKPVNDSSYGSKEAVEISLANEGNTGQSSIPLQFRVDGQYTGSGMYSATLPAGTESTYLFPGVADMHQKKTYLLTIYSGHTGDAIATNDTLHAVFINLEPTSSGLPREESSSLLLYPNPFTDIIHLVFDGTPDKDLRVSIHTLTGEKIFEKTISPSHGNERHSLYLGNMEPGIYIFRVQTGEADISSLVIKQ